MCEDQNQAKKFAPIWFSSLTVGGGLFGLFDLGISNKHGFIVTVSLLSSEVAEIGDWI